jgi:uncharacterized protein (TIGR02996 family)
VNTEGAWLQAILSCPSDLSIRLIFADWLQERDDPRADLLRLLHELTQNLDPPNRPEKEAQLRELLADGVQPVGPFRTNSVGMRFALIPPGTFRMGSPPTEDCKVDERLHVVTLTRGFFLGVGPVTQAQWGAVMGNDPSRLKGDDLPVDSVRWEWCRKGDDLPVDSVRWEWCQEFCKRLGKQDGERYRLPTEAEWEYACRAGTTTPFHFGKTLSRDQASYIGHQTTPVGSFPPNAWGLHNMHGNVWEWCQDWYGPYPAGEVKDPEGADEEYPGHVLRGGSWRNSAGNSRAACRRWTTPDNSGYDCGCRVVLCLD